MCASLSSLRRRDRGVRRGAIGGSGIHRHCLSRDGLYRDCLIRVAAPLDSVPPFTSQATPNDAIDSDSNQNSHCA